MRHRRFKISSKFPKYNIVYSRNGYAHSSCCISDRVLHTRLSCVPSDLASNYRRSAGNNSRTGHVPRLKSRECYFFLITGGTITAEVTERRRRSDLPDRGLDIPIAVVHARYCHDFMTLLNCVSQILIMSQTVPRVCFFWNHFRLKACPH